MNTSIGSLHEAELRRPTSGTPAPEPERRVPLIAPKPPQLSQHLQELAALETSGIYSNYGPVNTAFEADLIQLVFRQGACVTVCNATLGLMLAMREVIGEDRPPARRYALMPSFTFAATAHAAAWCGLTPLLCDIDPQTWMLDIPKMQELLQRYAGQVAVIVPYATFGNNLDLERFQRVASAHDVPVVVDAAASLGSVDAAGAAFGTGFPWPVVFSMHATKAFSVGEGGIIYCADPQRVERLRSMASYGFLPGQRAAQTIGLNAKLSEVAALTARLQLRDFQWPLAHREILAARYTDELGQEFELQKKVGLRQTFSFQSVLLPAHLAPLRNEVLEGLREAGVGAGSYFSPHLAEQPFFAKTAVYGALPVTEDVAGRIVTLPLTATMRPEDVTTVVGALREVTQRLTSRMADRSDHATQAAMPARGGRSQAA